MLTALTVVVMLAGCGSSEEAEYVDRDGDGVPEFLDCDDGKDWIGPDVPEVPYDGFDNDCKERTPDDDLDGDGFLHADDCDDENPEVHPGVEETCNLVDDDCDTKTDEGFKERIWQDLDGDGYGDPEVTGQACTLPDGWSWNDLDCDDADPAVSPDASEQCDPEDRDENCNGPADDLDPTLLGMDKIAWYPDVDRDGYGNPDGIVSYRCAQPANYIDNADDCDDLAPGVNPGAQEVCDRDDVDEDCDGLSDVDDPSVDPTSGVPYYPDADGDGYGDASHPGNSQCSGDEAFPVSNADDCDDTNPDIRPMVNEVCDALDVDENCNGLVDDDDGLTLDRATRTSWYTDGDGDGYGTGLAVQACDAAGAYTANVTGDCDDGDGLVNPGGLEVCDAADVDEDCNRLADDDDPGVDPKGLTDWYRDGDGDGYGDASSTPTAACDRPTLSSVADGTDCDDSTRLVSPAAVEVCDSADVDEDCDGLADDLDPSVDLSRGGSTFYADGDGDGHGDEGDPGTLFCDLPATGWAADAADCDDGDAGVSPEAVEVCPDGIDNDCSGSIDVCSVLAGGAYDTLDAVAWLVGAAGEGLGVALAGGADLDGDGAPDLVATTGGGDVWGVLGPATGSLAADFAWLGGDAVPVAAVLWADDLDGDGLRDLWAGVPGASSGGMVSGLAGVGGGDLEADAWAVVDAGAAGIEAGSSLAWADLDGDGAGDLAVGAPDGDGVVGVLPAPAPGAADLLVDAWLLSGAGGEAAGQALTTGDLDGDGLPDLVVGAPSADVRATNGGAAWLLYGPLSGAADLADAEASAEGAVNGAQLGASLAVGDVDGDGVDDLVAGAPGYGPPVGTGAAYVFAGPLSGSMASSSANATLFAATGGDEAGTTVTVLPDASLDGAAEVLVGSPGAGALDEGTAWLFYGPVTGKTALSSADAAFVGVAVDDAIGTSLAPAGDVDGDGRPDLWVGSPVADDGGVDGGGAWLFALGL